MPSLVIVKGCSVSFLLTDFRQESYTHFYLRSLYVMCPSRNLINIFTPFKILNTRILSKFRRSLRIGIALLGILVLSYVLFLLLMPLVLLCYEVNIYLDLPVHFSVYCFFIPSCLTDLPLGNFFFY